MTITAKDFIDWKSNPVTKAVFNDYKSRIEAHKDILSYVAGKDSLDDRFHAGYIQAFRDALEVSAEDAEVAQDD